MHDPKCNSKYSWVLPRGKLEKGSGPVFYPFSKSSWLSTRVIFRQIKIFWNDSNYLNIEKMWRIAKFSNNLHVAFIWNEFFMFYTKFIIKLWSRNLNDQFDHKALKLFWPEIALTVQTKTNYFLKIQTDKIWKLKFLG